MKNFKLRVEWKTNEYYDIDSLTLTLTDEKITAIQKAQALLKENPDFDSIRVMIEENCISADSNLHRLGYGFVLVRAGEGLYFIGTDHYDSRNQVETDSFSIDDGITEEPDIPTMAEIENFIDEWGQTHDEICVELGYDEDDDGTDEMLMGDGYKWFEKYQKWFPKTSSIFSERDQVIMDYLCATYC